MSGILSQLGTKDEVTWGTAVVVDRFNEMNSESIQMDVQRIESSSLRAGTRVQREDRWAVNRKGAEGDIEMEVMTKGFGLWLKRMLGTVATSGPTDSKYTHTATIATLTGVSFTTQVGRPFAASTTVQPFTYNGCKVANWEFSNSVDGILMAKMGINAKDETTATALATASYPTGMELFTFAGGAITIGGSSVSIISDATVSGDNGLNTTRYGFGSQAKNEQVEDHHREVTFSLSADFVDLTNYNRYVSLTTAGAQAQVVLTWTGPTLIGASSYPTLVITIPAARFDGETPTVDGPEMLTQTLSGKAFTPTAGTSAVTIAYGSADTTP